MSGPEGAVRSVDDADADAVESVVEQVGQMRCAVDKGGEERIEVMHAVAADVFTKKIPLGRDTDREVGSVSQAVGVSHDLRPRSRLSRQFCIEGQRRQAVESPKPIDLGHEHLLVGFGVSFDSPRRDHDA